MSVKVILQARTGSSRLPRKVLMPFHNGASLLEFILQRLIDSRGHDNVIVATSDSENDNPIQDICQTMNLHCYRGSEQNVLDRYIKTMEHFNLQEGIRICGDNPFLDLHELDRLIAYATAQDNLDYASFLIHSTTPAIKTHYGFWTEYIAYDALKKIERSTQDSLYTEHVTNYTYEHPEDFEVKWLNPKFDLPKVQNIRFTIDDQVDFDIASLAAADILSTGVSVENCMNYVEARPGLKQIMKDQISKYQK